MVNSLNLDDEKEKDSPRFLTDEECSRLQILLNKIWLLREFSENFNKKIDHLLDDSKYVIHNLSLEKDLVSYLDGLKVKNTEMKNAVQKYHSELEASASEYLEVLREHRYQSSWDHPSVTNYLELKLTSEETIQVVKNYFSNVCSFTVSTLVLGRDHELFLDSVLSSEPLYLLFPPQEHEKRDALLKKFNDLQKSRFRIYDGLHQLQRGIIGNIVAWDFIHTMDHHSFTEIAPALYSTLQPGGVLTMNYPSIYNPKDFDIITQSCFGAYDPFLLEDILKEIGFDILKHDLNNQIIYIKKPGILTSGKASPTISTIVNIDSLL